MEILLKVETASWSSLLLVGRIGLSAPGCQIAGTFCHFASHGRWEVSRVTAAKSTLGQGCCRGSRVVTRVALGRCWAGQAGLHIVPWVEGLHGILAYRTQTTK